MNGGGQRPGGADKSERAGQVRTHEVEAIVHLPLLDEAREDFNLLVAVADVADPRERESEALEPR